ncbi:CDP-alcohol phosphatidyltransferase family protein [Jatrophihabitans fulvus]
MNSPHPPLSCTRAERGQAWAVHIFTTIGVVFGALSLQAVLDGRPDLAIIYLMATLIIDGVDGPVARALGVKERLPQIDGYVLDLIIDFVCCVIVPAAFMYQFGVVPNNWFGLAVLGLMVLTSAIWFSRTDMMTDDNFFRGFPAAWNMVGPLLWLVGANTWVGAVITIVFSVLQLSNMPYPHIVRAKFFRPVTALAATGWLGGLIVGAVLYDENPDVLADPDMPTWLIVVLLASALYYVALAAIKAMYDRRERHRAAGTVLTGSEDAEPKDVALGS